MNNEDLFEATHKIVEDIIKNKEKYNSESLYSLIPKLAKKYVKFHNDSIDWECIVMLMEKELNSNNYSLSSCNLKDLKNMI